jgi:hypothetical protein
MKRLLQIVVIAVLLAPGACGGQSSDNAVERARAEAKKTDPDAVLVQVEFNSFGFAAGSGGIPDMTKAGPPKMALFNFYSPKTGKGFRVVADINRDKMPAEMEEMMRERGYKDLRVERGDVPYTTYTLPLPEKLGDFNQAVEAARKQIDKECAGAQQFSSCRLLQSAELHMHWAGPKDGGGTPVWTVTFGQHPQTLENVASTIDASGRVYSGGDAQPKGYGDNTFSQLHEVNLKAARDFDAAWPAAVAAVQKQDALYAPYAVSLITYLSDVREVGGKPVISEAHIQFARLTPSLQWDEVEAHVGWKDGSADQAVLFFGPPKRHAAPGEPKPVALKADGLPRADSALAALLKNFPEKYAEVQTVWTKGCEDVLTMVVGLSMWRCGVYVEQKVRTDLVFLWLSHQGNPYWSSGRAPLGSEYQAVTAGAPKDGWVWWTRVKHPERWEYFLTDAMSGRAAKGFCTNPNHGTNAIQVGACK